MGKNRENYEQLSFLSGFGEGNAEGAITVADSNSTKTEKNRQAKNKIENNKVHSEKPIKTAYNSVLADSIARINSTETHVIQHAHSKEIDTNNSAKTEEIHAENIDSTKTEKNATNSNDLTKMDKIGVIANHSTELEINGINSIKSTKDEFVSTISYNSTKSDNKSLNICDATKSENISVNADDSNDSTKKKSEQSLRKGAEKVANQANGGAGKRDKDWDDFNQLFSFRNLYRAHLRSRNSKRFVPSVVDYEMHISSNIIRLRYDVLRGEYAINAYKKFYIYEPKKRLIQACAYVDRVVQHCLCDNYLTGLIDSKLIYDNCACRKNKGLDFAVRRVKKHLQSFYNQYGTDGYCLRVDISKYFQSIDKEIVLKKLNRHVTNRYIMGLISRIVLGYDSEGLPIGNQISQTLAIYYLNDVDRFIKEVCRVKYYTRYMDDFFILHHDKAFLEDLTRLIREECEKDKLTLNAKTMIIPIKQGIDFIGKNFMLEDNGAVTVRLRQVNKRRIYRRIKYVAQSTPMSEQEIVHKRSVMASYTGLTKRIDGGRKLVFNARTRGERLARRRADGAEVESE